MNEITRLEDLSEDLQKQMIDLYWRGGSFVGGLSTDILERRYIQMNTRGDMCLTSDGAALVADYHQRQQVAKEPSTDDLAAQLAAAEKRIADLEAGAKLFNAILDALIREDTYRANDLADMAYKLGRYGATTASRQEDMATYIQGVIRRLKGTQS